MQPELHDHALHLCVNAFKDKLVDALPGAVRDLELLTGREGFSPEKLAALAKDLGAATILWLVATWIARTHGAPGWERVRDALGRSAPRPAYTALFERAVQAQPPRDAGLRFSPGRARIAGRSGFVRWEGWRFARLKTRSLWPRARMAGRSAAPNPESPACRQASRCVAIDDSSRLSSREVLPAGSRRRGDPRADAGARPGPGGRGRAGGLRQSSGRVEHGRDLAASRGDAHRRRGRPGRARPAARATRVGLQARHVPVAARHPRKLREERTDIVHVHAPNPTMFLALATLPPFSTLVVTHHSDVVKQRVLGRVFAPVERRVHERAALVLSDSEAYVGGSSVLRGLGSKVRALPLGLDLAPFVSPNAPALAAEARLRSQLGQPLWLAVGRLVYYKGLMTAIDGLAHLPGRLLVVGTGPLEPALRAHAKTRKVADRIEWLGHVEPDDLVGAYRAATALWFPSNARSEGFGLVQVEAMASGCPVINTAIPHSGVSWVSRDGESGLTIPVGDPKALVAASRRLLDESGLREALSVGAVERARREFDDGAMARRCLELYSTALGRSAPRKGEARLDGGPGTSALEAAG